MTPRWALARLIPGLLLLLACNTASVHPHAPVPADQAACRSAGRFEVLHYDADLKLDLSARRLFGTVAIRVRGASCAVARLGFDAPGLQIESVREADNPVHWSQEGERIYVEPSRPLSGTEVRTLVFHYEAGPSGGLHFYSDHVYTSYFTSRWMVALDDPAQRASLRLQLTVAQGLTVVGSGRPHSIETLPDGRARHAFTQELASPSFLYGFAVGRFQAAQLKVGTTLLVALLPESLADSSGVGLDGALDVTARALRFLMERSGMTLPDGRYTEVFVAGDAEQEAAGLSFLSHHALALLLANPHEDWLLVHELAHQFYGYLVPCADFADFWLNEGMATFLVAAWKEQRWGAADYEQELAHFRRRYARAIAAGKDQVLAPRPAGPTVRGVTYSKGALVLHLLRRELGESAFWNGLRRYTQQNAGRPTRTAQLQAALQASCRCELEPLFRTWVRSKSPELLQARHIVPEDAPIVR